jgi:hypothetical protein
MKLAGNGQPVSRARLVITAVISSAERSSVSGRPIFGGRLRESFHGARHARLVLNSAVTVSEVLLDTWQQRH